MIITMEWGNKHSKGIRYNALVEFSSDKFPDTLSMSFLADSEHDAHVQIYKTVRDYIRQVKVRSGSGIYNGFIPKYSVELKGVGDL